VVDGLDQVDPLRAAEETGRTGDAETGRDGSPPNALLVDTGGLRG
jgi:hypothetical protein